MGLIPKGLDDLPGKVDEFLYLLRNLDAKLDRLIELQEEASNV